MSHGNILNLSFLTYPPQPESLLHHHIDLLLISQNHRMVGLGSDLCRSSSPTPLPKQGHLQQAAQDLFEAGVENLQRRRVNNLSGNLSQCSVTLRGKKFFLMFRQNFLCFSLCPLPLVLLLGTTEKSLPYPLDTHP